MNRTTTAATLQGIATSAQSYALVAQKLPAAHRANYAEAAGDLWDAFDAVARVEGCCPGDLRDRFFDRGITAGDLVKARRALSASVARGKSRALSPSTSTSTQKD
tara:strand:+ start:456 stop:770 length:315 start_codon:yes stop_codon:yes gene_type:complete